MKTLHLLLVLVAAAVLWVAAAHAQGDRRDRAEPMLMIETGARMGSCDALAFTPDGKYLLATGDDKVVRVWRYTDKGLEQPACQTLRWSIWRERRGAIYALAISPDRAGERVAVGGLGVRNGSVVVLERETGRVVQALGMVKNNEEVNKEITWSLAFAPSSRQLALGKEDGSVWLWNLDPGREHDVRKLGRHRNPDGLAANRVRQVAFLDEQHVLSVARDGTVVRWDLSAPPNTPDELFRFEVPSVFRVAVSADHQLLAAAGEASRVELRTLEGRGRGVLQLEEGHFPQSLVFDPKGEQLAVGIRVIAPRASFFKEVDDRVVLYDLRADPAPEKGTGPLHSKVLSPFPGPKVTHHADALAFHPGDPRLAVAGGNDHELALWDLGRLAEGPLTLIRGPGTGLWSVRLARDGNSLGYQTERLADPPTPNQRARGPWHVFDLQARRWSSGASFQPAEPLVEAGGWRVQPDSTDANVWHVVGPDGSTHRLPGLDPALDGMPRCYTFLEPRAGKPVRLAVGHYWGFSLFELDSQGPRRVRLFNGHQGEVTAIAPSADQQVLLTASRDQTIAAWSLVDWPARSALGARFEERLGKLFIDAVDPGSPAWEAGLTPSDEVLLLAVGGKQVSGGPAQWLERLRRPAGNVEHYFRVKQSTGTTADRLTRLRERPLWHFFPTRDGEWVLWRHYDHYYDASLHGDAWIGWQISRDVDHKPEFYPARQFSGRFYSPAKIAEALRQTRVAPERIQLVEIEPPELSLTADARVVKDGGVGVRLRVTPRGNRESHRPERVILWIGAYRYKEWVRKGDRTFEERGPVPFSDSEEPFEKRVTIPAELLRCGDNRLSLQCFSSKGMVSALQQVVVRKEGTPPPPRLFLVQVGVADFTNVKMPRGLTFGNLPSVKVDLELLKDAWRKQEKRLFQELQVTELVNEKVTAAALEEQLAAIARQAKPEDVMVLFLNGHGYTQSASGNGDKTLGSRDPAAGGGLKTAQGNGRETMKEGTFVFLGSHFDWERPAETGITADLLYRGLTEIPCRKLVLLSACHSGDATRRTPREPVRDLIPGGVGPIILSAAQHNESAFADDFDGSLFAQAIAEALEGKLPEAFRGQAHLDSVDFVTCVKSRVLALFAQARQNNAVPPGSSQTPVFFPVSTAMDRFPLARQAAAKRP